MGVANSLTWTQAFAWRMQRQLLDPIVEESVEGVVDRLGAVRAQDAFAADLSINTRRTSARPTDVADALRDGRLIKTFAFRGATQLMTPESAGMYLSLRASSRMWELPSWQEYYNLKPADWPALRDTVRGALAGGPLSRDALGNAVTSHARFKHLASAFRDNNWTLLKPLAWHGDISFEPSIGGPATFQRLDTNPRWIGLPDVDEAGTRAVVAYFSTYGPATTANLQYWLGEGLGAGRKRIAAWFDQLNDRLTAVEIEGETNYVVREHLDEVMAARENDTLRLLPAYDQWVMGPGTADAHVTPPLHRPLVSRGANIVIVGGVVSGSWTLRDDEVSVDWFGGAGPVGRGAVSDEIGRLATILGRPLKARA